MDNPVVHSDEHDCPGQQHMVLHLRCNSCLRKLPAAFVSWQPDIIALIILRYVSAYVPMTLQRRQCACRPIQPGHLPAGMRACPKPAAIAANGPCLYIIDAGVVKSHQCRSTDGPCVCRTLQWLRLHSSSRHGRLEGGLAASRWAAWHEGNSPRQSWFRPKPGKYPPFWKWAVMTSESYG